tara:strand:+ start:5490 stop:6374 length:885 start_codon:yes stop_codon:yes gene_type:complete
MAFEDVTYSGERSTNGTKSETMNFVSLRQLIDDFIVTMDSDDYISNVSDTAIRNIALRGIREFGFDVSSRVRSIKRTIQSNNTVILPEDYVDLVKIGVVDSDGILRVLGQNKNLNYSRKLTTEGATTDSEAGPLNLTSNIIKNREDDKNATAGSNSGNGDLDHFIFENYLFQGGIGRLYGLGGGHLAGEYRINLDQNRIEIDTDSGSSEIVLEYIADEARSTNPVIHVYAEEALRSYMYYKLCERKSTVPANEKARARREYYNDRRLAKARLSNFSKDEALKTIRKNYLLAPKY